MSDAPAARIDSTMEDASQLLVKMRYAESERLCLDALAMARAAADWDRFARILLPLQEARRQRRQIAADAGGVVLTGDRRSPEAILDQHGAGCLLLTDPPYTEDDAVALRRLARERGSFIEVLVADSHDLATQIQKGMEDVGDELLASLPDGGAVANIDHILESLDRVGDHELVHQKLAALAREAQRAI